MTDVEIRGRQAQELADRLRDTLQSYHDEQEAAGTPMLMNDMLAALAHVTGSALTQFPDVTFTKFYHELGVMVMTSYELHRSAAKADRQHQEAVQ